MAARNVTDGQTDTKSSRKNLPPSQERLSSLRSRVDTQSVDGEDMFSSDLLSDDALDKRIQAAIDRQLDDIFKRHTDSFEERWKAYEQNVVSTILPLVDQKIDAAKTELSDEIANVKLTADESKAAAEKNKSDIEQLTAEVDNLTRGESNIPTTTRDGTQYVSADELDTKIKALETQLEEQKRVTSEAQKQLLSKIENVELHGRKLNLVFDGIEPSAGEDCKRRIEAIMKDDMHIEEPDLIDVAHRQYLSEDASKIIPIVVRFKTLEAKQLVLKNGKLLKSRKIYIRPDMPQSYVERRTYLAKYLRIARQTDDRATLVRDKLLYNKKLYSVDTIHTANLTSSEHTSVTEHQVRFYGHYSPFSNFYRCHFKLFGREYNCVEQALMVHRARRNYDHYTAQQILCENNPAAMKRLGNRYYPRNETEWNAELTFLKEAVHQKFATNTSLRKELLDTGSRDILECNPYDRTYSTGLAMDDPKLDNLAFHGTNHMGKILEETRSKLTTN